VEFGDVREGATVELKGPDGHLLKGQRGEVGRVMSVDWLNEQRPMDMLVEPFAWVTGQVLVRLFRPPEGTPGRYRTPYVTVRPEDIEPVL
jgi:hypothetical protein